MTQIANAVFLSTSYLFLSDGVIQLFTGFNQHSRLLKKFPCLGGIFTGKNPTRSALRSIEGLVPHGGCVASG